MEFEVKSHGFFPNKTIISIKGTEFEAELVRFNSSSPMDGLSIIDIRLDVKAVQKAPTIAKQKKGKKK